MIDVNIHIKDLKSHPDEFKDIRIWPFLGGTNSCTVHLADNANLIFWDMEDIQKFFDTVQEKLVEAVAAHVAREDAKKREEDEKLNIDIERLNNGKELLYHCCPGSIEAKLEEKEHEHAGSDSGQI